MTAQPNPIMRICRMLHDAYQHLAAIEYCQANRNEPTEGLLKDISAWLADYDENAAESDSPIAKLEDLFNED